MNPVSDEVLALTAIVRPILTGVLYALRKDIVDECGGYQNVKLKMLPRLYRAGDGDCGICFEYAVHEALIRNDTKFVERIVDAARLCNVPGEDLKSLLFGLEKNGSQQIIETAQETLTDESRLLAGTAGQPIKLRKHLGKIAGAFKNRKTRPALPWSIRGLWKADLFVGFANTDRWVATTVKINPANLEGAAGLRIGIVPTRQGTTDRVRKDENKNLVVCPLHHDQSFMQAFYEAWRIVQAFIGADARVPAEVSLPRPAHREVARILEERREFAIVEVIDAIRIFGQPEFIESQEIGAELQTLKGDPQINLVVAPISLNS